MATGELYAVRNVGQLADRFTAFNEEWSNYKISIEFALTALQYENTAGIKKEILELIDNIYLESKSHFHKDILTELAAYRSSVLSQILENEPTFSKQDPQNSDGGCFIATAVYGDYNAPEVLELRDFRDNFLANHHYGIKFIKMYYKHSPIAANYISKNNILKFMARILIVMPVKTFWKVIKLDEM